MSEYIISRENAKLLAVGVYSNISRWVADAKHDNPNDYERFKANYYATQASKDCQPIKRRQSRKHSVISR